MLKDTKPFLETAKKTLKCISAAAIMLGATVQATPAAEKITFMMSWRAQADQGGYFQALAKGYYAECGLDVEIRQGGPGIDPAQLLAGGAIDFTLSPFIDTVVGLNEAGFPARSVMAIFQRSAQMLMTREGNGIEKLEDMKGSPIMIAAISRRTFWPFFRDKYGWDDSQIRQYTGQLAPFLSDPKAVQQGFITNEPFLIKNQTGETVKTFLLADHGYQTYGTMVVTSQTMIDQKPEIVQCMVDSIKKGWADYLQDPSAAFEIIKKEEPKNTDELMNYAFNTIKELQLVETDETREKGFGYMNEERWKAHHDMLVSLGLFKPFDYKSMYTLQFLNK